MQPISDHLLLKAIRKESIDRTPLWIMRQAGRYLPEYIDLKNKAGGFMNLVKNPELACQITLQPLERFSLDSAIIFSDILVVADMLGIQLSFEENKGPIFDKTIKTEKSLNEMKRDYDISEVRYVFDAIEKTKKELNGKIPLIGFIGSPWTVTTYLIEGNSSKIFENVKKMISEERMLVNDILTEITEVSIRYINQQIKSGVDAVMIFDTWGGLLQENDFYELSVKYVEKIKNSLTDSSIPVIYYIREPKNKIITLNKMDVDVIGIDSTIGLGEFRKATNNRFAVQGNLDKDTLKLSEKEIHEAVEKLFKEYDFNTGHIFNLGTGITPDIDPSKVNVLIDAVKEISPKFNREVKNAEV